MFTETPVPLGKAEKHVRLTLPMRSFLCTALLLAFFLPIGASAGGFPEGVASDCRKKALPEDGAGNERSLKGFVDPDTGDVLTYEQARDMGIVDGDGAAPSPGARASAGTVEEPARIRKTILESGDYVIEINPSFRKELRATVSEDGKTELECHDRDAVSGP